MSNYVSVGAIVGVCYNSTKLDTESNNYYLTDSASWGLGTKNGNGSNIGASPVDSDTLKGLASKLGTEFVTNQDPNINNGYPLLKNNIQANNIID